MGNSFGTVRKSDAAPKESSPRFHYGDQEAEDYITEVLDNCVWRKAVNVDGKMYWATSDPDKLGAPVQGEYKYRHFWSHMLLAPMDDEGDSKLDAEAVAKRAREANDARVGAFLDKVATRLLAHLHGSTDDTDQREGGPRLLTSDRMQTILEKVVNQLVAFYAKQGMIVSASTLQKNLDQSLIKSAIYLDFATYIPDLITDGVLVTDVHGKLDQDFDNLGPELSSESQMISGGLPMFKHREDRELQHHVLERDMHSFHAFRKDDPGPDEEAAYESESSMVSQDHCRDSPHYPVCNDNCWLRHICVTGASEEPEPPGNAIGSVPAPIDTYQKLAPGFFRVLVLQPGTAEDTISCELNTERFADPTQPGALLCETSFEALSYTWGNPTSTNIITCNGADFSVGRNLFDALRYLRLRDKPRVLWIDAVCINQHDVDERNEQIRYMYAIYQSAAQVIVWLGSPDEQSDLAMQSARYLKSSSNRHDIIRHDHDLTCIQNLEKIIIALESLLERPWFRRSWVRQEIAAATQITVVCGSSEASWTALKRAANTLWRLREKVHAHPFGTAYTPSVDKGTSSQLHGRLRFLKRKVFRGQPLLSTNGDLRSVWYYHAGGLLDHLMVSRAFEATDPRDKVYAVLGMANVPISTDTSPSSDPELPRMPIAYAATVSEVYQQTAKYIINRDQNLDILCILATHRSPSTSSDLPSWVPDWRIPTSTIPLYDQWEYFSYKFGAAGFTKCRLQSSNDHGKLIVDGFCITHVGQLLQLGVLSVQHPPEQPTGSARHFDPEEDRRRMAMTEEGGAIVPSAALMGDPIWILMGCKMPMVLRADDGEEGSDTFRVVGPCHLQTAMWGKSLKKFEESGGEMRRIVLV